MTDNANMLREVLDALKIDKVDVIGNDSGAAISQVFAARFPSRLRSLTITNCEVHDLWPNAMLKAAFDQLSACTFPPFSNAGSHGRQQYLVIVAG